MKSAHLSSIAAEKFWLPLLGDVLHNCKSFSELDIFVEDVRQVRVLHTKGELLVQPVRAVPLRVCFIPVLVISPFLVVYATVLEKCATLGTKATNVPVAKNRNGVDVFGVFGFFIHDNWFNMRWLLVLSSLKCLLRVGELRASLVKFD